MSRFDQAPVFSYSRRPVFLEELQQVSGLGINESGSSEVYDAVSETPPCGVAVCFFPREGGLQQMHVRV